MPELLDGLRFGTQVDDRASGADWLLEDVEGRVAKAVIPAGRNRTKPREHDRERYGWRHRMENPFAGTREFRAIAIRQDRHELRGGDSPRRGRGGGIMIVNRP